MKTAKLIAVLAAGVLVLAGCSSTTSGTPSAVTSAGASSTPAAAASSAPAAATSSAPAPEASSPMSSVAETPASESAAQSGAQSSEEGDSGGSEESSESQVTVGGAVDGQTTAWFSTFCAGFASAFTAMSDTSPTAGGKDEQTSFVQLYGGLGDAFIKTANALQPLPPPTFNGGDKFAADVVKSLGQAGPQLKQAAQAIAAVDPSNQEALESAIEAAGAGMETAMSAMAGYALDDNTEKALESIPACAPLAATGGSGEQTTG